MSFVNALTVDDALAALAAGAKPVAGGSDLVVGARQGKAPLPASLVAIDRIDSLKSIEFAIDGSLHLGALVSHSDIESNETIASTFSALADASALVGSPATRHVGTLGGNVMNASPAMDTGAPLIVLGAVVELRSSGGTRRVTPGELWTGPGRTSASADELCTGLSIPARPASSGSAYVRLEYRRAMEIAVVGAAAAVTLDGGSIASVSVALTAVAPTILSVDCSSVVGQSAADAGAAIAALASAASTPITDVRASDGYRRNMVGVMAKRAFEAAVRRAQGETIAIPVNRSLGIGAAAS